MGSRSSYLCPFTGRPAWWRSKNRNAGRGFPRPPRVQVVRGKGVRHNKHRRKKGG